MKKLIIGMGVLAMTVIAAERNVYIGTYTKPGGSQGIYLMRMDDTTGKLSKPELAAEAENPSFLAVHPNGKWVFAVNETNGGKVSAYAVNGAKLTLINTVSSKGDGPCHL